MSRIERIFQKFFDSAYFKNLSKSPALLPLIFLTYDFGLLCVGGRSFSSSIRYKLMEHSKRKRMLEEGHSVDDCDCISTEDSKCAGSKR